MLTFACVLSTEHLSGRSRGNLRTVNWAETGLGQRGVMSREVFESRAEVVVFLLLGKHWHPEIMAVGMINDHDSGSTKKARTRGNLS